MKIENLLGKLIMEYVNNDKDLYSYVEELYGNNGIHIGGQYVSDHYYLVDRDDDIVLVSKRLYDNCHRDCISISDRGDGSFLIKATSVPPFNKLDSVISNRIVKYFEGDLFGVSHDDMVNSVNASVNNIELYAELCSWSDVVEGSVLIDRVAFNKY